MRKRTIFSTIILIILLTSMSIMFVGCNQVTTLDKILKFDTDSIVEIVVSQANVGKITTNRNKISTIKNTINALELTKYTTKTYDSDWDTPPNYKISFKQADKDGSFEIIVIIRDIHDLDKGVITGSETLIGLRKIGNFDKKSSKEGFYTTTDTKFTETVFHIFLNIM